MRTNQIDLTKYVTLPTFRTMLLATLFTASGTSFGQASPPVTSAPAGIDPVSLDEAAVDLPVLEAGDSGRKPTSAMLFFENDGTFARPNNNTDRHYTSGQGLALGWRQSGPDALADRLGLPAEDTAWGLTLVHQIYTPDNFDTPIGPDDRPYAGYLYVGGFWQREHNDVLDHIELDLGVVGPSSKAEEVQEVIHDIFGAPDPDWSTQLGDEIAVNLTLRRKWRIDLSEAGSASQPPIDAWAWQVIPEVGLDVGTVYRRAHVGGTLRFGFNLPDDFGPARLIDPGSITGQPGADNASSKSKWSGYAFVKAVGRYVEWNKEKT